MKQKRLVPGNIHSIILNSALLSSIGSHNLKLLGKFLGGGFVKEKNLYSYPGLELLNQCSFSYN